MKLRLRNSAVHVLEPRSHHEPRDQSDQDYIFKNSISTHCIRGKKVVNNLTDVELLKMKEVEVGDFDHYYNGVVNEKGDDLISSSIDFEKRNKLRFQYARQRYQSSIVKSSMNHGTYAEAQSNQMHGPPQSRIKLEKLGSNTLRRYWLHFNLESINPTPSEEEIVSAVCQHFVSQQVDENEVIEGFIHAAKRQKTRDPCRKQEQLHSNASLN